MPKWLKKTLNLLQSLSQAICPDRTDFKGDVRSLKHTTTSFASHVTMKSGAYIKNPPAFLPQRRPASLPNLTKSGPIWHISNDTPPLPPAAATPPFIPQPHEHLVALARSSVKQRKAGRSPIDSRLDLYEDNSRPQSLHSSWSGEAVSFSELSLRRSTSNDSKRRLRNGTDSPARSLKLEPIRDGEPLETRATPAFVRRLQGGLPISRQSSLRNETRLSEDGLGPPLIPPPVLTTSYSDRQLVRSLTPRPYSHPSISSDKRARTTHNDLEDLQHDDPWQLPSLPPSRSSSQTSRKPAPRPRASFTRLSSLDNLITYRQEKAEWKRASSMLVPVEHPAYSSRHESKAFESPRNCSLAATESEISDVPGDAEEQAVTGNHPNRSKFRHFAAEVGFCFTIAMTQFLAEYLISGFAIELPNLLRSHVSMGPSSMGMFWPASLLSLILSATLLFWARLSDLYSGYFIFMFGVAWLAIWTLIPGFCKSLIWIDVSRAMQGLAIAAFMPSTFSMVGSIYPEGPRKNFVLGLYSGCAPLGFFAGFLVAGALPAEKAQWYWFVAAGLSLLTLITAFLSVPSDRTDRRKLGLKMDWIGSFLIMSGLILVSYALSVEPYANQFKTNKPGFAFPIVIGPFASGIACLAVAFWYEGWIATCPLLPFDFFKPKSVKAFSFACMCFYASYGVWLYNSAQFFQILTIIAGSGIEPLSGMTLAVWYTPTAVGGIILCIVGGIIMHVVPIMILLLVSALAWIGAPLLLALAPLPLHYWEYVVPSMLCATIGIDLTFTVSIVFFSSVQPLRYQGLSGAVCSILVNLAMSFALSISEIVLEKESTRPALDEIVLTAEFRATFIYAAASAGLGLVICVIFVRISRSVVQEQQTDEEMGSSDTTLVDPEDEQTDEETQSRNVEESGSEA